MRLDAHMMQMRDLLAIANFLVTDYRTPYSVRCMYVRHIRVARLLTRPAGRVGSGRVGSDRVGSGQKIYRKRRVGSGRVQFGQKLKFNFKVP